MAGTRLYSLVLLWARVAAILLEIDANDLNKVLASRHFIMLKIGDFLGCSEHALMIYAVVGHINNPLQHEIWDA